MRKLLVAGAAVLALHAFGAAQVLAANGDCGQPQSNGSKPNTSDALYTLRVAVGALSCPMWVCNVDNNLSINTGDALRILKVAVGQVLALNCPPEPTTTTSTTSTTSTTVPVEALTWTEIQGIFTTSCADVLCHTAGGDQGGQSDLDDYDKGYAETVDADAECEGTSFEKRVVPGDPENSFLMAKLDGTADCKSDVGSYQMPMLADPLSQEIRDGIRAWILEGAPKN